MNDSRKLVVIISQGLDNERASVAWSLANGGINSGLDVSVFLVSAGVDWARKGAAEKAHPNPMDPTIKDMVQNVIDHGCHVGACPPCSAVRGYEASDFLEGIEIVGAAAVTDPVKAGAAVISL